VKKKETKKVVGQARAKVNDDHLIRDNQRRAATTQRRASSTSVSVSMAIVITDQYVSLHVRNKDLRLQSWSSG